jgi:hypothetical protein
MDHCDASRLLADAMAEVLAAASHISQLLEAAPSAEAGVLDITCKELGAVAVRARILAMETRSQSLRRAGLGPRFAQVSAEIAILADRCGEAVILIRRLQAARDQRGEKLARRTSLMPPAASLPSTIS